MTPHPSHSARSRSSVLVSVLIFCVSIALMAYLRLYLYQDRLIQLTYGLPLLLCLWHRSRVLLWSMATAFVIMSAIKAFFVMPDVDPTDHWELLQWIMQLGNIFAIAVAIQMVISFHAGLLRANEELAATNEELKAQQEKIKSQNDELQAQAEELAQQNEELQQQAEELSHQNEQLQRQGEELSQQSEELAAQSEVLQTTNEELREREEMLKIMLSSFRGADTEQDVLKQICGTLVRLLGRQGLAAAVVERQGDHLVVRSSSVPLEPASFPFENSLAAIVAKHNQTAFIEDLDLRPDLVKPRQASQKFRSVLASPLRFRGIPLGAVEAYSELPRAWSSEDFRLIEWVGAQCSVVLEALRLQEELRRSQQDLAAANAGLERTVEERTAKLKEMVEELEHFSYSITHDMRAPLRAMQGFAGILQEHCGKGLDAQAQEYLNRIARSAVRMDRLITDALDYSKTVQGEMSILPVDADALLHGMLKSYPDFQPPRAEVEVATSIPPLLCNEAGLTQCFSNLLGNAVKFVPRGTLPRVRVRAESSGEMVRIWIEDNGIGIPAQAQHRMFRMFQRATGDYEGTGIGLALVRKVTERMGGRVGFESELGKGSRFWLELRSASATASVSSARSPTYLRDSKSGMCSDK